MYTVEPADHWRAGDRAYCVREAKQGGRYIVERGRMYRVAEARQYKGMMPDGLRLEGIDLGDVWGFWSGRFVCVRGAKLPMHQIAERTRHKWFDAYVDTARGRGQWPEDYPGAQGIETRRAATVEQGAVHESPVAESDAPNPSDSQDHP